MAGNLKINNSTGIARHTVVTMDGERLRGVTGVKIDPLKLGGLVVAQITCNRVELDIVANAKHENTDVGRWVAEGYVVDIAKEDKGIFHYRWHAPTPKTYQQTITDINTGLAETRRLVDCISGIANGARDEQYKVQHRARMRLRARFSKSYLYGGYVDEELTQGYKGNMGVN